MIKIIDREKSRKDAGTRAISFCLVRKVSKIFFLIVGLIKYIINDHSRSFSATSELVFTGLERPESWPVAAKIAKNSAVEGIRIFVESGLEGRLIVKTTVKFFAHLACPFIRLKVIKLYIY